eukprot:CAMPEP_0201594134 /NCGR_PEP_ID=MMETSP0190_2-20130828/191539_1 /ASSEMBLY_ACC=CAM_ASM_000263 /TAXON_ID=37353 /ORGANISM="Rosalina sp." /LENGTH=287 /DNA_ID=CAMNT_0048053615 /DNA_START=307 /DNA_END=1167 /DNA_ORIENTATION=-
MNQRTSDYDKDRTNNYDPDSNETERIMTDKFNRQDRPTITEWHDDDDDEDEDEKDTIDTVSVVESLPTSGYFGSPPTTNYVNSAPSTTGHGKVLSTVNELLPIPAKTNQNDGVNVTPSPSTSPPSTPKHKPQQHNEHNGNTIIVLQSRSDGSTLSGGTSNLSTITMDFATDADMDGIILDEGDEEDEESTLTNTNSNTLEMKTNTSNTNNMHSVHQYEEYEEDDMKEDTQTQEYTLMRQKYQNAPQITYDDRRNSMSSSAKMFTSLKLKFDNTSSKIKKKIKRRNSW